MEDSDDGDSGAAAPLIEVSYKELSTDALRGVIENFVLREGTEYGEQEVDLEYKVSAVIAQLEAGDAVIVFDPDEQTVDIRVR